MLFPFFPTAQGILLFPFLVLISLYCCCCCCCELFTSPRCPPLASLLHPVSGQSRRFSYWTETRALNPCRYCILLHQLSSEYLKAARVTFWCLSLKSVPVGASDDCAKKTIIYSWAQIDASCMFSSSLTFIQSIDNSNISVISALHYMFLVTAIHL